MNIKAFRVTRILAVLLLAAFATACGGSVDLKDPKSVAKAGIEAWAKKDIATLLKLIPEDQRAKAGEALEKRKDKVFSGWRQKAAEAYKGGDLEVKTKGDRARVKFHDMSADEVAVVSLKKIGDNWYFHKILSPSKKMWDEYGK